MNSSLLDNKLNEDNYEEYVDKIINIFRLSNKESSIICNINIIDFKAIIELSIISNTGEKQEFTDEVFKCDDVFFKNFIIVLIKQLNERIKITVKDIIKEDKTDLVTFRMITDNNDIFTVTGLSKDDGKSLLNIIDNKKEATPNNLISNNDKGVSSAVMFALMIGIITLTFFAIIMIID